jgi:hypothetical protein
MGLRGGEVRNRREVEEVKDELEFSDSPSCEVSRHLRRLLETDDLPLLDLLLLSRALVSELPLHAGEKIARHDVGKRELPIALLTSLLLTVRKGGEASGGEDGDGEGCFGSGLVEAGLGGRKGLTKERERQETDLRTPCERRLAETA